MVVMTLMMTVYALSWYVQGLVLGTTQGPIILPIAAAIGVGFVGLSWRLSGSQLIQYVFGYLVAGLMMAASYFNGLVAVASLQSVWILLLFTMPHAHALPLVILTGVFYVAASLLFLDSVDFWLGMRFVAVAVVVCSALFAYVQRDFARDDGALALYMRRATGVLALWSALMLAINLAGIGGGNPILFVVLFITNVAWYYFNRHTFNRASMIGFALFFVALYLFSLGQMALYGLAYSGGLMIFATLLMSWRHALLICAALLTLNVYFYMVIGDGYDPVFVSRFMFMSLAGMAAVAVVRLTKERQLERGLSIAEILPDRQWLAMFARQCGVLFTVLAYLLLVPVGFALFTNGPQSPVITLLIAMAASSQLWLWLLLILVATLLLAFSNVRISYHAHLARDMALAADRASQVKSQFLSNMSHEMRTPLNGIVGLAQVIQLSKQLPDELRSQFEALQMSAQRLAVLVEDTLDITRIESGKLHLKANDFDPRQLLQKLVAMQEFALQGKDVRLVAMLDIAEGTLLYGDENRVGQIVDNLLTNAVKFTESGDIVLRAKVNATGLTIAVQDTGIGMSEEVQKTIFQRFAQADMGYTKRYQGVGLGLAIVKELVERMGGKIDVVSSLGQGSCFTVRLPLPQRVISIAKPAATSTTPAQVVVKGEYSVLVVEDDDVNVMVLEQALADSCQRVLVAKDGLQALALLAQQSVDLILTDISMPNMGGEELLQHLQQLGDSPPVVAITGNATQQDKARFLSLGFTDVLTKPIELEVLLATVATFTETSGANSANG